MIVGSPKEIFKGEARVAMTPESAKQIQKLSENVPKFIRKCPNGQTENSFDFYHTDGKKEKRDIILARIFSFFSFSNFLLFV